MGFMDINLTGQSFNDYKLTDVGSDAYQLEHDWFTKEDLVITTGSGGGGTPLSEGMDYQLSEEDEELSERVTKAVGSTRTVYHYITIINATYQTGDLYHSGKYIADNNSAADMNALFPLLRGMILGLTLSNNATDANNDIDIAAGKCLADGGTQTADMMVLSSALTKRSDAAWSEGTNQGGMDTGSKPNDGILYVWLIRKPSSGNIDALFSVSCDDPTMPSGYTQKRRIGAVRTNGSGNIHGFIQDSDWFWFKSPILDVNDAALSTTRKNYMIQAPPDFTVFFNLVIAHASSLPPVYVSNPDLTDMALSSSAAPLATIREIATGVAAHAQATMKLDSQSRLSARSSTSATTINISILAWRDRRGKDENA